MLYITNSGASSCETRRGATALRTGYRATAPLLALVSPRCRESFDHRCGLYRVQAPARFRNRATSRQSRQPGVTFQSARIYQRQFGWAPLAVSVATRTDQLALAIAAVTAEASPALAASCVLPPFSLSRSACCGLAAIDRCGLRYYLSRWLYRAALFCGWVGLGPKERETICSTPVA